MLQCLDYLFNLHNMPLYGRLVGTDIDFLRICKTADCRILDINGNINQYRTFSAGIGNIKGFLKDTGNILHVFHKIAVFYKGLHSARDIRFLEYVAS